MGMLQHTTIHLQTQQKEQTTPLTVTKRAIGDSVQTNLPNKTNTF